jgi:transcriptional regulator with XRE-family HTH domain
MADIFLKSFGKKLRNCREAAGLSQEQLGELSGLHRNYIGGMERGERNPTITSLKKVSKALGISLSKLFKGLG